RIARGTEIVGATCIQFGGARELIDVCMMPSSRPLKSLCIRVLWHCHRLHCRDAARPRRIKLMISDSDEGIEAAAVRVLNAPWLHCREHFMRHAMAHAGK